MPRNPQPLTSGSIPTYRQLLLHRLGQETQSILSLDVKTLELTTWYWCTTFTTTTLLLIFYLGQLMEKSCTLHSPTCPIGLRLDYSDS